MVTDPHTGLPVTYGTTRRRPTATQQHHVWAHHPTCVFPGCRHDHNRIRHRHGRTYQPLPGGDWQWTTRLGHTNTTSGTPP